MSNDDVDRSFEGESSNTEADSDNLTDSDLNDELKQINDIAEKLQRSLEFSFDDDADKSVIVVRDATTQIIRQIPTEKMLEIAKRF